MSTERVGRAVLTLSTESGSFFTGIEQAKSRAKSLGSTITGIQRDIARMANSFSGRESIAEATKLTSVVTALGGVQRQTVANQRRINAVLSEGIEQYRVMGRTAPKAMVDLEQQTRRAEAATGALTKGTVAMGSAFGSFVGTLAANVLRSAAIAVYDIAKGTFDAANNFLDLNAKTGVATDKLQRMKFVGDQIGTTLDTMAESAFRLSANIAGAKQGDSVAGAVSKLHLNLKELQAMNPGDQFETIVAALHNIQGEGQRNKLGIELFGRSFSTIAAAVAQDYASMASSARIATRSQLEALSQQSQEWKRFVANITTGTQASLGSLLQWIKAWELAKGPPGASLGFGETIDRFKRIREELARGNIELPSNTKNLDLNADAMDKTSKAADELAKRYAHLADLSAQAFGLDAVTNAKDMVDAIGGMSGLALMDAESLKSLNKTMDEAIAAAERNGQIVPLEWFRILEATRDNVGSLQEYLKTVQELPAAMREIPPPPELIPFTSELDIERTRALLAMNAPGTNLHHAAAQAGESIGAQINKGIGRAFEQVPHFLISSILHSGGFKNGLKAIGVDMADAIVEPLIKRFVAKIAGARLMDALAGGASGAALGAGAAAGAAAAGGGVAAGAGGAAAGGGLGASLAAFATNPFTLAAVAAGVGGFLLYKHFHQGPKANDTRDKDLAQFAAFDTKRDPNNPPGFFGLDAYLTKYKRHDLFTAFIGAKTIDAVRQAWSPIAALAASQGRQVKSYALGGFTPPGAVELAMVHGGARGELHVPLDRMTSGREVHIHQYNTIRYEAQMIDAEGADKHFERHTLPRLKHELTFNNNRLASITKRAIED